MWLEASAEKRHFGAFFIATVYLHLTHVLVFCFLLWDYAQSSYMEKWKEMTYEDKNIVEWSEFKIKSSLLYSSYCQQFCLFQPKMENLCFDQVRV